MKAVSNLNEKEYLTVSEIQSWLGISHGAAYNLTHRKNFPVLRIGSAVRIPRVPFLAWVAAHTSNPMNYGDVA